MKKILFLCLIALFLTASCSKSNKNDEEEAVASKTIDLGEAESDENGDKADKNDGNENVDKTDKPDKADMKSKRIHRDSFEKGKKGNDEIREMARKNDEASKNPDGSSKRGKPAAQIEAEEQNAAKEADNKNAAESADDNKNAAEEVKQEETIAAEDNKEAENPEKAAPNNENDDDGFDFSDEPVKAMAAPPRQPKVKPNLEIEKYINIREFREQTNYSGALAEDWLPGQYNDVRYTSVRLSTNDSSQLGFTIQIWRPGNETAATKRFSDLFSQSFGGQKIKSVANDAFIAKHHKIVELGFVEKSKRTTVLLSCSENICNQEQLKSIALIIQRRL